MNTTMTRREATRLLAASALAAALSPGGLLAREAPFRLRYILPSCMYGTTEVAEILREVRKIGAEQIDIWPRVHGDQREQVEAMGHERFAALLGENKVKLGILTRYDLGPFKLSGEFRVAKKLGAKLIICGSGGPRGLEGKKLRSEVKSLAEKLKPVIASAEENGITLGIENHGGSLIQSPDSQRWFVDEVASKHVGIALAPYHLPQRPEMLAKLIEDLGPRLAHFYAWQHGMGCHKKLPKEQELLQMPGRGSLNFTPIVAALKKIDYRGWTEIFMHPVPRGIPILETTSKVTVEINRARRYLEERLA